MTREPPTVVVVGSLNHDLVVRVSRLPGPGETVLGSDHFAGSGGKGANQAVAAAKLGCRVTMVGRVGDDDAGRSLIAALDAARVDTSHVIVDHDTHTGLALITLDATGENSIVVSPGANHRVEPGDVAAAVDALEAATVTLLQLEIPIAAVLAAARAAQGTVILNSAPARPLDDDVLGAVDILIPNRTELGTLGGQAPPRTIDEVARLATRIRGPGVVIVTLGAEGALLVEPGRIQRVRAPVVDAVDTTASGDAFCGALAAAIVEGRPLHEAVRWAVAAGAVAATRPGAQSSLPRRDEIEALRI